MSHTPPPSFMQSIRIRGARTHNLQNISLDLPSLKLICLTGPSGSGKSSLAFDTIFAEGQRRYIESLSSYARQFLSMMEKPDIDSIEGLSPAISIQQKTVSHNPRSTVGTVTEIYDYLRLLYARIGQARCPLHGNALAAWSIEQMIDEILSWQDVKKIWIEAPVVQQRKGSHHNLFSQWQQQGFLRVLVDGQMLRLDETIDLDPKVHHDIGLLIDRLQVDKQQSLRISQSIELALQQANGLVKIHLKDNDDRPAVMFSSRWSCPYCGFAIAEMEPKLFSFNNPAGACSKCDGIGHVHQLDLNSVLIDENLSLAEGAILGWGAQSDYYFSMLTCIVDYFSLSVHQSFASLPEHVQQIILYGDPNTTFKFEFPKLAIKPKSSVFEGVIPFFTRKLIEAEPAWLARHPQLSMVLHKCSECSGHRLKHEARAVFVQNSPITELVSWPIQRVIQFFETIALNPQHHAIAAPIIKEIQTRLHFLVSVGLNYLTLSRKSDSLSGGESQRIRLASQLGSALVGVTYVLDEPTIGLHPRDNNRLIQTLMNLRDIGNTVIVVEHDEETMLASDIIVEMGPGAGRLGGKVIAVTEPNLLKEHPDSLTGSYLSRKRVIALPKRRQWQNKPQLIMEGCYHNNLKQIDISIPLGVFVVVTGVSGSGKSSLINHTLFPLAEKKLTRINTRQPLHYQHSTGWQHLDKVIAIDQSPIGRTPRSNPATYTGLLTPIRELLSSLPEARARGYKPGRFSFNVPGGRCEACQGDGMIRVEMHFLADIFVQCEACKGKRFQRETLDICYREQNIADMLAMTVDDAMPFFANIPQISKKLQTLQAVGLGYVQLGQSGTTLSGGEAQRIKLARELAKRDTGKTLYILDEPTTGLHVHDVAQLLVVLQQLVDRGNSVIVIEHHLDVIKCGDYLIDLGPEGGELGGYVLATGSPEQVAKHPQSVTGPFLKPMLTTGNISS